MGGHGGLNILPQKKWNVYNHDNRAKVERDKKKLHEKRNQEVDKQIKNESTSRIIELREAQKLKELQREKKAGSSTSHDSVSSALKQHSKYIEKQERYEQKSQKRKGVNLFEMEEQILNSEAQKKLDMQNSKFYEGKPFDLDTKFGGNFKNQQSAPWYVQAEKQQSTSTGNIKEDASNIKKKEEFKKIIDDFRHKKNQPLFKVIDQNYIPQIQDNISKDIEDSSSNSSNSHHHHSDKHKKSKHDKYPEKEKKIKKDKKMKKSKKHDQSRSSSSSSSTSQSRDRKKEKKQMKKKDQKKREKELIKQKEEQEKQDKLKKMREERMERERNEQLKSRELLRSNNISVM